MLLRVGRETVYVGATYIFALFGGVEGGASSSSGPTLLPSSDLSSALKRRYMECTYSHCTATLHVYSSCAGVPASLVKYGLHNMHIQY